MKRILSLILALIALNTSHASNISTTGAMSLISLGKRLSTYGSLNFQHYDVFNFKEKSVGRTNVHRGWTQTYFQTSYSYQYLPSLGLTLGHIYQRNNPFNDQFQNENRIFEQITYNIVHRSFTSSHRLRFEQRFIDVRRTSDDEFRTRLRYQIGARVPLRGLSIDANEFYINTYNEFYFSTGGNRNAFFSDDWAYMGMGLRTKEHGNFELGPLAQWSIINSSKDTRTHYVLQFAWVVNL